MADHSPRRRRGKFVRLLKFALGLDHLSDGFDTEPPTLYEQLDELFGVVADEESRWRRNLGSRRR